MSIQETSSNISFGFFIHSDEAGDQMYREYISINGAAETTQRLALLDAKFARSNLVTRIFGIAMDILLFVYLPTFSMKSLALLLMVYETNSAFDLINQLYDSYVKLQPNFQNTPLRVAH